MWWGERGGQQKASGRGWGRSGQLAGNTTSTCALHCLRYMAGHGKSEAPEVRRVIQSKLVIAKRALERITADDDDLLDRDIRD